MANTFYQLKVVDGVSWSAEESLYHIREREYIMHSLNFRTHSIWNSEGFWDLALDSSVKGQLVFHEALRWDDLSQSALVDHVLSTHNLIFGQLSSLALLMYELGLGLEEVSTRAEDLARKFELSEDQRIEIINGVYSSASQGAIVDKNSVSLNVNEELNMHSMQLFEGSSAPSVDILPQHYFQLYF